jgi:2,4-dienoyl-CoA reductase-like NADH-dependent reductase (Old Yellow Enzyme family)
MQLWHLGRTTFSAILPDGASVVSASDIPIEGTSPTGAPYEKPRPLTVDEIKSITQDYAQAAKNAIQAGFDG